MRLKVGEFSRLCQVPVKTLRYYDDIGLFKPSEIDRFTAYRYYTLDQLPRIHRIIALKELGFSLNQIAQLLTADLSSEQIHEMLLRKQTDVQQRIDEELQRLNMVKFHLQQIELSDKLMELPIVIKRLESFPALTLRKIFPKQTDIDDTGNEILKALATNNFNSELPPMGIAYVEEFRRHDLDFEFVLPTATLPNQAIPLENSVLKPSQIPELEAAATYLHRGDYDSLNQVLLVLQRWVVENGYRLGNQIRMVYFRGPMHRVEPSEYLTELQHQLIKIE